MKSITQIDTHFLHNLPSYENKQPIVKYIIFLEYLQLMTT